MENQPRLQTRHLSKIDASRKSEQKPQSELNLPGLVIGRTSRCSEGRDESAGPGEGIRERGGYQVGIVQNIEHLSPELHLHLLAP